MKNSAIVFSLLLCGCLDMGSPPSGASKPQASVTAPTVSSGVAVDKTDDSLLKPGMIKAIMVTGDIKLLSINGTTKQLVRGDTFTEGTTVLAGPNANGLLAFSNGSTIRLQPNMEFQITLYRQAPFDEAAEGTFMRLAHDPSRSVTVLDLKSGVLQGEVKQLNVAAGSTFDVKTPSGPVHFVKGPLQINPVNLPTAPSRG